MPTVELDAVFEVYADVDMADVYFSGAYHGASWRDLEDEDEKARLLVTATRTLDRQRWKGDKTDAEQELQWPRSNTSVDGVEDDTVPDDIINASLELALSILDGSDVQTEQTTTQRVQSMSAGSVSITNFRSVDDQKLRFPLPVQELVGKYLAGAGTTLVGVATGVDTESVFPIEAGLADSL